MATLPICPECGRDMDGALPGNKHAFGCSQYAHTRHEGEELARLYLIEAAARHLVMLKEGPRDSVYHREKDRAWAELRAALATDNGNPTP